MSEENEIHTSLMKRSKSARRSAWFSVSLIVTTVFMMISFFYVGGISPLYIESLSTSFAENTKALEKIRQQDPDVKIDKDLEKMKLELELKKSELDLEKTKLEQTSAAARRLTSTITESVTKVGAVLIALYMVQILLSLTRYHFRLADHLAIVAESMKHSDSDVEKLKEIMEIISINHIDFGKSPTTPTESIIDLIKALPDKISANK